MPQPGSNNGSVTSGVPSGTSTVPVNLSTKLGSATLVYPRSAKLVANTPVKVFGIPQADGPIKCYVLAYFTDSPKRQPTNFYPGSVLSGGDSVCVKR